MGPRSNLLSQKNGRKSRDTVPLSWLCREGLQESSFQGVHNIYCIGNQVPRRFNGKLANIYRGANVTRLKFPAAMNFQKLVEKQSRFFYKKRDWLWRMIGAVVVSKHFQGKHRERKIEEKKGKRNRLGGMEQSTGTYSGMEQV